MSGFARLTSLLVGSGVALLLMFFPFVLGTELSTTGHIGLLVLLLGVSGTFVHGFGYTPERTAWRVLFSPVAAWLLMLLGSLCLGLQSS